MDRQQLFARIAPDLDPASFYCPHGHQWHECAECDELSEYRGSDPALYGEAGDAPAR